MRKIKFFFITVVVSFCLSSCTSQTDEKPLKFIPLTKIALLTKTTVQPISWIPGESINIKINLNSTQNPDLIKADIKEMVFLETELEDPIEPLAWNEISRTEYDIKGVLNFPITTRPKHIRLSLFIPDEIRFFWDFPQED